MNCRKQLGIAVVGEEYAPPKTPIDLKRLFQSTHLRAYARSLFNFLDLIPGTLNATTESYRKIISRVLKFLVPNANDTLITQNVASDTILFRKTGISFESFFDCTVSYAALVAQSNHLQSIVDIFYKILQFLNEEIPKAETSLTRPTAPLPLNAWEALIDAAHAVRPCFVVCGVNTQRAKLFEKVLSDRTGALLLDIPTLIQWPLRGADVDAAKEKLTSGGYITYKESSDLIINAAKSPEARYRGWILPSSFKKDNFDVHTLFESEAEYMQRCFFIDLSISLDSLIELAKTRKFDPQDEKIISTLEPSSVLFVQRLKRREFVGREIEEAPEEEEEDNNEGNDDEDEEEEPEEKLMLYTPPKYLDPEEAGDETVHPEEEDEALERMFTLPEESEKQLTQRFNRFQEEKNGFQIDNPHKHIIIDATQSLNEQAAVVCDRASIIVPCVYPNPIILNEEEEQADDQKFSPVGDKCVVSLVDDKMTVPGDIKIGARYYGMTFYFKDEEYRRRFCQHPIDYLKSIYHTYHHRILITGSSISGKKALAAKLSEFFETPVVDFKTVVEETRLRIPKPEVEEEPKEETEEAEVSEEHTSEDATTSEEPTPEEHKEEEEKKEEEAPKEGEQNEEQAEGEQKEEQAEGEPAHEEEKAEEHKEEEAKKEEPLQPVFETGYITIMEELDAESLKVFQENESLAPEVFLVLKMKTESEFIHPRIEAFLKDQDVDPSQADTLLEKYTKLTEEWLEKFNEFSEAIHEIPFQPQSLDATLPMDEVFWGAAYIIDPLLPRAGESSGDDEEPVFGYLGPYCPVTMKDKKLLVNGSESTTTFQDAQFGFADETAMDRFRAAPLAFISSLPAVPPPKILIVGSRGTSKSSIAQALGKTHNVPVFELPRNPEFHPISEEEEEPDPEETTRTTIEPFVKMVIEKTDEQRKGWIIEGTPQHAVTGSIIVDSGLKPDIVISLEHDEKWALMRNHHRLQDDEQILTEEGDYAGTAKEVADTVAEISEKREAVTIETSRRFTSIMKMVNETLQRELKYRDSLFLSQSSAPLEEALPLLESNKLFLSQFGRYCPVCLYQTGQLHLTDLSIACSFLGRVFFFETNKHRQLFMDDPLRFATQLPPPLYPFVPKVTVLGAPELAQKLAETLSAELIRPRDVIARVARHNTTLGAKVRKTLATGGAVDSTIFKEALSAVLARQDCQVRGYVLDGYPMRLAELIQMRSAGIMPNDIVVNKGDEQLINHSIENFHNVIDVSKEDTTWMKLIVASDKLRENMVQRWESFLAIDEKRPYCISALDVSPEEVQEKLIPEFRHYCPVTFTADCVAVNNKANDWENIVMYNNKIYHMKDKQSKEAFLASPTPFIYNWAKKAVLIAEPGKESEPEVEGYDIVELKDGKFTKGDAAISALLNGKTYFFVNEDNRAEFCRNTIQYVNVKLPPHRPVAEPSEMTQTNQLPTVAFLEQSVGDVVTECIVELTKRRPKIPGKGFDESMYEYVASFIRAHSENVGPLLHDRFVQQMDEMNEKVSLAQTLKKSLETPVELRNEEEHERLCALWKSMYKKN